MSLIHTLNRLLGNVLPCATPCNSIVRYSPLQRHSTSRTCCSMCYYSPHLTSDPIFPQFFPQPVSPYCVLKVFDTSTNGTKWYLVSRHLFYLELSYVTCTHGLRSRGLLALRLYFFLPHSFSHSISKCCRTLFLWCLVASIHIPF